LTVVCTRRNLRFSQPSCRIRRYLLCPCRSSAHRNIRKLIGLPRRKAGGHRLLGRLGPPECVKFLPVL